MNFQGDIIINKTAKNEDEDSMMNIMINSEDMKKKHDEHNDGHVDN